MNNEKWYTVPPSPLEGWRIFNEGGEWVANFEDRQECELTVKLHNIFINEKTKHHGK